MLRLVRFQFERSVQSRKLFFYQGLLLIIGILGFVLCNVFFSPLTNPLNGMLCLYNSFTQFYYLSFAYILISIFARDIQTGSVFLFKYMGYSNFCVTISKLIYCIILILPLTDVIVVVGANILGCHDAEYMLKFLFLLDLCMVQVILIACVLSLFIRKVSTATIVMCVIFVISDLINSFCFGTTIQGESNSLTSYFLTFYSGLQKNEPFWNNITSWTNDQLFVLSIVINTVWIILLSILISLKIKDRKFTSDAL